MRWLWSFLAAVLFVFASFVLMLVMIFPPKNKVAEPELKMGYFIPKQQQESSDPAELASKCQRGLWNHNQRHHQLSKRRSRHVRHKWPRLI